MCSDVVSLQTFFTGIPQICTELISVPDSPDGVRAHAFKILYRNGLVWMAEVVMRSYLPVDVFKIGALLGGYKDQNLQIHGLSGRTQRTDG